MRWSMHLYAAAAMIVCRQLDHVYGPRGTDSKGQHQGFCPRAQEMLRQVQRHESLLIPSASSVTVFRLSPARTQVWATAALGEI